MGEQVLDEARADAGRLDLSENLAVGQTVRLDLTDDSKGTLLRHLHNGYLDGGKGLDADERTFNTFTTKITAIDGNEQLVESQGIDLHTYVAPGTDHTVVQKPGFYTEQVGGTKLVDWVRQLLTDDPPRDVHCTQCRTASGSTTTTTATAGG